VLGIDTVDLLTRENALTVWLTSAQALPMLAEQTTSTQAVVMAAYEEYLTRPGADLIEPILYAVPASFDQAALEVGEDRRARPAILRSMSF
jgi:hypothetical protein